MSSWAKSKGPSCLSPELRILDTSECSPSTTNQESPACKTFKVDHACAGKRVLYFLSIFMCGLFVCYPVLVCKLLSTDQSLISVDLLYNWPLNGASKT